VVPPQRTYTFHFRGIVAPEKVHVSLNQKEQNLAQSYDSEKETFVLEPVTLAPQDELVIELVTAQPSLLSKQDRRVQKCQDIIKAAKMESLSKAQLFGPHLQWGGLTDPNPLDNLDAIIDNIGVIDKIVMEWKLSPNRLLEMDASVARALIEIITKRELFSNFDTSRENMRS
jgi:hypothetical protein